MTPGPDASKLLGMAARGELARSGSLLIKLEVVHELTDYVRELQHDQGLLLDLLAVIHGDGGHYVLAHGTAKAYGDAMEKFCSGYTLDQLKTDRREAWNQGALAALPMEMGGPPDGKRQERRMTIIKAQSKNPYE